MSPSSVTGTAPSPALREIRLSIRGMTCAACANRVEKNLSAIEGVDAAVNFATEKAIVSAPPSVSPELLIDAVQQAGYDAELADPGAAEGGPAGAPASPDAGRVGYLRRRLIVALVFFVPLGDLSVLLSLFPAFRFAGWQWVLVALTVPVAGWAAWPFHSVALKNARHGSTSMDTLVSLGIIAACGWSVYAMFVLDAGQAKISAMQLLLHGSGGGIYLEVAASVTTFLLAGRWYEAPGSPQCRRCDPGSGRGGRAGRQRAGSRRNGTPGPGGAAAAGRAVRDPAGGDDRRRRGRGVRRVGRGHQHDDRRVGARRRCGRRRGGCGHRGGERQAGDPRHPHGNRHTAGAADRPGGSGSGGKSAAQRLADRICGVFVPAVLLASTLTLAGWLLAGAAAERGFSAALAVLIIACPCALGLATPAALVVACGRGAQLGIFIKGYQALEVSRSVDTVLLDKTGTITTGVMAVTGVHAAAGTGREQLLRNIGAVENASGHPVAVAVSSFARSELGSVPLATDFTALPGMGVRGFVAGSEVIAGRPQLLTDRGLALPPEVAGQCADWEQAGRTTVLAGWDGQVRGAVAVADVIKPSAVAAVAGLRRLGLRSVLLTGDSESVARAVAAETGVDEVIAGALPGDKAAVVRDLQARGCRVAMAGDGINRRARSCGCRSRAGTRLWH